MRLWMTLVACFAFIQHAYSQSYEAQWTCEDPHLNAGERGASISQGTLSLDLMYFSRLAPDDDPVVGTIISNDKVWPEDGSGTITLKTNQPIKLGSLLVPVGAYSLFVFPSKQGWQLVVNKALSKGAAYDESKDIGRVKMLAAPAANCKMLTVGSYVKGNPKNRGDGSPKLMFRFAWNEANYYLPITRVQDSSD